MMSRFGVILLIAGLLIVFPTTIIEAQNASIAVVVNPENKTGSLSLGELRKIFAGEKRSWPGGVPIKLLIRAHGTRERNAVLGLLRMSESEYKQHWTAQVYRGEGQSEPVVLPSFGITKEAILAYPGAIALVEAREVKGGMKVLKVDGHLPGEAEYAIH